MMINRIKNNATLLNSYGTFFYFFCQWLTTILVVRLGGYYNAGVYSLAISTTNIFYCIALYGVRNYQVSDVENQFSDSDYLIFRFWTIFVSFIIFLASLYFLKLDQVVLLTSLIYIFYKYGEAISDLFFAFFQKYNKYDTIALSFTFKGIITLITFIIVLFVTDNIVQTVLWLTVSYFLILIFFDYIQIRKTIHFDFKQLKWKRLIKICLPLMFYIGLVPFLNFITRYSVETHFGIEKLGYYSSITMLFAVLSTLTNSIFVTIIPKISGSYLKKDYSSIQKLINKVFYSMFILLILGLLGGYFLGDFMFSLVFGKEILPYMNLLPMTIVCAILLSVVSFLSSVLISIRKLKSVLFSSALGVIACVLSLEFLVSRFGMQGSLYCLGFALVVICLLSYIKIRSNLKSNFC